VSLQISHLRAKVEDTPIIRDVSLTIQPGELHALMGPNGSGKSSLALTLAGHPAYQLAEPNSTAGQPPTRLRLDGHDLLKLSPDERGRLGLFLAFQYPAEIPGVTVQNFLWQAFQARFGADQARRHFDKVIKFRDHLQQKAEQMGVNPLLLKRGLNENFSGGEKKRLEMLQLAVLEPKYAILDETDSGLDIDALQAVAAGINQVLADQRPGMLIITHYRRILDHLKPNAVHVMIDGRIARSGGAELVAELERQGYRSDHSKQDDG